MTDKTSKLIGKSIIAGFAYNVMVPNPFPYDDPTIILASIFVSIILAVAIPIVPTILYAFYYISTKNKEKSKKVLYVSFDIIFWIWMTIMALSFLTRLLGY